MTPLIISLRCCLFRAICEVMKGRARDMLRDGQKVCLLPAACLVPRTWDRDLQFQRISGKLLLVTARRSSRFRPSFGPRFLPEQTFWCAALAPNNLSVAMLYGQMQRHLVAGDLCFGKLQSSGVSRKAWLRLTRFVRRTTTKRGA